MHNKRGNTPLHEAIIRRSLDAINELLDNGADPDIAAENKRAMTPRKIQMNS